MALRLLRHLNEKAKNIRSGGNWSEEAGFQYGTADISVPLYEILNQRVYFSLDCMHQQCILRHLDENSDNPARNPGFSRLRIVRLSEALNETWIASDSV